MYDASTQTAKLIDFGISFDLDNPQNLDTLANYCASMEEHKLLEQCFETGDGTTEGSKILSDLATVTRPVDRYIWIRYDDANFVF